METCIIRVCRNDGAQPAGLVETGVDGSLLVFHDFRTPTSVLEQATGQGGCVDNGDPAVASGGSAGTLLRVSLQAIPITVTG